MSDSNSDIEDSLNSSLAEEEDLQNDINATKAFEQALEVQIRPLSPHSPHFNL